MTVRDSSKQACGDCQAEQSFVRARILGVLTRMGAMTRRQIAQELSLETSCVAGRVNELVGCGAVIEEEALRPCPVTGRRVHWISLPPVRAAA